MTKPPKTEAELREMLQRMIDDEKVAAARARAGAERELLYMIGSSVFFTGVLLLGPRTEAVHPIMAVATGLQWVVVAFQIACIRTMDERLEIILDGDPGAVNAVSFKRHVLYRLAGLDPMPLYRRA